MEAYMAATAKSQIPASECGQRLKSEGDAQAKNDFCQNSAHLNQMSFIPVYSNKSACHKLPKSKKECEIQSENPSPERKVLSTYSPPVRPRCAGNSDMLAARFAKTHMRRRSVGFEDMTSLSTYYGHNYTNDRRFQGSVHNSNMSHSSAENHTSFLQSDAQLVGKLSHSDNTYSSWNHNAQLTSSENANDPLQQRFERSSQRFKDKSSKRKSSLNRMDFIQFPNTGCAQYHSDLSQQKNSSSSDEGSESRLRLKKTESPSGTVKRKISAGSPNHETSKQELKTNEVTLRNNSPSKVKSSLLPKSSPLSQSSLRQNRWKQSHSIRFSPKLSHSAGELESLTDLSEVPSRNKTYSSAQEYDDKGNCRGSVNLRSSRGAKAKSNFLKLSSKHLNKDKCKSVLKDKCDITSQVGINNEDIKDEIIPQREEKDSKNSALGCDSSQSIDQTENISSKTYSEQIFISDSSNNDLKSNCDDSKLHHDSVETAAINLETLEITDDESKNVDVYLSAEESVDSVGSDGERRPSSILRKKSSDERKELHSILKPSAEDKFSKTPPSILKHRESSEEKDLWQSNDLHSILKKSTSEDESCNSGPDIRPILKLSTDEDSPSGGVRPRPILKKRTSFSDECSYVSFPSGELKPILKKKTPLSSDEQPKPILKSRRKSEDSRSTMSEVITSRPRAYSADMGVKLNHESQADNCEAKDFCHVKSHDL